VLLVEILEKVVGPYWTVATASGPCGWIWSGYRWECSNYTQGYWTTSVASWKPCGLIYYPWLNMGKEVGKRMHGPPFYAQQLQLLPLTFLISFYNHRWWAQPSRETHNFTTDSLIPFLFNMVINPEFQYISPSKWLADSQFKNLSPKVRCIEHAPTRWEAEIGSYIDLLEKCALALNSLTLTITGIR
jgi:hypothetical protein